MNMCAGTQYDDGDDPFKYIVKITDYQRVPRWPDDGIEHFRLTQPRELLAS
jgi:hypothetical protein